MSNAIDINSLTKPAFDSLFGADGAPTPAELMADYSLFVEWKEARLSGDTESHFGVIEPIMTRLVAHGLVDQADNYASCWDVLHLFHTAARAAA